MSEDYADLQAAVEAAGFQTFQPIRRPGDPLNGVRRRRLPRVAPGGGWAWQQALGRQKREGEWFIARGGGPIYRVTDSQRLDEL